MRSIAKYVHHLVDNFYQIVGPVDALSVLAGVLNLLSGMLNLPFSLS